MDLGPAMGLFQRSRADEPKVSLYYASDVHGSRVCWRKFVNARRFYGVDALIMGGDLCGKGLVPVTQNGSGHVARVAGEERRASTAGELDELERAIRLNGFYPWRTTNERVAAMREDPRLAEQQFLDVMLAELREWVAFAEERLASDRKPAFVMPGNDDPWEIDPILGGGTNVRACDGEIVRIGDHEMLSLAWANRTPWDTAREFDEDELYRRIRALTEQLEAPRRAIFNLHVPPYDSGLDIAVELDETLAPVIKGGRPHEIPVGSTAVRQILEEVQPLISLHGHIHESRGISSIGDTVAINPGSDYGSGRIEGCVVELGGDRVLSKRLVSG